MHEGLTLGTPIAMLVRNEDSRGGDYDEMRTKYRPSHADYTYQAKFGIRAWQGGGRASARETVGRVAAGALARKVLGSRWRPGWRSSPTSSRCRRWWPTVDPETVTRDAVEANIVRCPEPATAERDDRAHRRRAQGRRLAGRRSSRRSRAACRRAGASRCSTSWRRTWPRRCCRCRRPRASRSAAASRGTRLTGIEHNDPFYSAGGTVRTRTNRSGGVQGGITNGEAIVMRVAFKPTATILREQETVDVDGKATTIKARGRHDPCVLPRAVPIVEAMMALVLADHALRQRGQCG